MFDVHSSFSQFSTLNLEEIQYQECPPFAFLCYPASTFVGQRMLHNLIAGAQKKSFHLSDKLRFDTINLRSTMDKKLQRKRKANERNPRS